MPVADSIAALARLSWAGVRAGSSSCWCSQVAADLHTGLQRSGGHPRDWPATLLPIGKNVAWRRSCRIFSQPAIPCTGRAVDRTSARRMTFAQSTSASSVCFAWPVHPPSTKAATSRRRTGNAPWQPTGRPRDSAEGENLLPIRRPRHLDVGTYGSAGLISSRASRYGAAIGDRSLRIKDVGEQRMPLRLLDDRGDTVVPADAQVVALSDVVGEHHPRPGAPIGTGTVSGTLRSSDCASSTMTNTSRAASAANNGSAATLPACRGRALRRAPRDWPVPGGVEHRLRPAPSVALAAGQVSSDRRRRATAGTPRLLRPAFQHGLETGARASADLPVPAFAASDTMPTDSSRQQIEGDALFGGPSPEAEHFAITAHQLYPLLGIDPPQRVRTSAEEANSGVARIPGLFEVDLTVGEHLCR